MDQIAHITKIKKSKDQISYDTDISNSLDK